MGGTGICYRKIAYKPLPSQRDFHRSPARFKGFSGPVGSGKSQALCHEAVRMAYLNPGRLGLLAAPTHTMLRDITCPALFDILDHNRIPYTFNKSEKLVTLLDCRSKIVFRSAAFAERLRGTNLAWFGVDELTFAREAVWERLEARLRDPRARRRCGFGVWTPNGFDWVYRKFISEPVPDYHVVLARPFENHYILDEVPDYYDHLKQSYSEEFFKQEVLGQYLNVGCGLVYHHFNRLEHVRPLAVDPARPLRWTLDFNVNPMSSVVAQTVGDEVRALDEIVIRHATTDLAAEEFVRRYAAHRAGIIIYGDATGYNAARTGPSDYDLVKETLDRLGCTAAVFHTDLRNPPVQQRVRLVNGKLRNAFGQVQLFIDPKCQELIKDFEQVSYQGDTLKISQKQGRTHTSDALGYLIVKECAHKKEAGPQPRRLL